MNKNELRKAALAQRQTYSEEECVEKSNRIASFFFSEPKLKLSSVTHLHLYLPIRKKKEIDTFIIFHKLTEDYPHIRLVLSKSDFENNEMKHFLFTKEMQLQENSYGIPEPVSGEEIRATQLDMVLVPLLAFDEQGNRIGYGGGFYDRFLATCRPNCIKVGLSFEPAIARLSPESFDIPLDLCVTPERIYDFREVV